MIFPPDRGSETSHGNYIKTFWSKTNVFAKQDLDQESNSCQLNVSAFSIEKVSISVFETACAKIYMLLQTASNKDVTG